MSREYSSICFMASCLGARGFTLVELGVALTVVGVLLAMGIPNAIVWMKNAQIRATADSVSTALSLARVEALRRNVSVEFVLTDDSVQQASPAVITPSLTGKNWMIRLYREDGTNNSGDFIQSRAGAERTNNVRISSNAQRVVFNSLGDCSLTDPPNIAPAISLVSDEGECESAGGRFRCLEVDVKPGGMIKMCDPRVDPADPRTCAATIP